MTDSKLGGQPPTPPARPRPIARYQGVIELGEVQAELTITNELDWATVARVVAEPPEWQPFPWPQVTPQTDDELRRLALLKLLGVFEFNAGGEGATGEEIRAAVLARHPALQGLRDGGADGPRVAQIPIQATIYEDGYFDGGYTTAGGVDRLPFSERTEAAIDHFVKNMVRADLRDKIGDLPGR